MVRALVLLALVAADGRFATRYPNGSVRSEGRLRTEHEVGACRKTLTPNPIAEALRTGVGCAPDRLGRPCPVPPPPDDGCGRAGDRMGRFRLFAPDGGVLFDQTFDGGPVEVDRALRLNEVRLHGRGPAGLENGLRAHMPEAVKACQRGETDPRAWGPLEVTLAVTVTDGGGSTAKVKKAPMHVDAGWAPCFERRFREAIVGGWEGTVEATLLVSGDTPVPGWSPPPRAQPCGGLDQRTCEATRGCQWGILRACPGCLGGPLGCQ